MDEGLESKGSDAEIPKSRSINPRLGGYYGSKYKVPELDDVSYAGSSIIRRMVVKGYDTSPHTRGDVEEALRKHLASRGIKLIHAYVPVDYGTRTLCSRAFIYVYEEYEAEALKLEGSDMGGGRILDITSYPFEDNHLDHVFPPIEDTQQRTLTIAGFDTSLDEDDIEKMLLEFFPESGLLFFCNGCVYLAVYGLDTTEKALKLSGSSVRGYKIAVTKVYPVEPPVRCGLSSAARFALGKKP
ncbi:hypothetical protein Bca101_084327 [Brassica carinata]